MLENPPILTQQTYSNAVAKLNDPKVLSSIADINNKYLYWSEVKYKKVGDLSPLELWAAIQLSRLSLYALRWPEFNIKIPVTSHMQEMCHYFDMNFGGTWGTDSIIPNDSRERFLASSQMEEAIASSQIEGSSTTRKVAKDMLRRNISPRNKAEQMIHNNYEAIKYITENKDEPLSPAIILRLHEIMTEKTLDNPDDAGKLRTNNDIVVQDVVTGEVVHRPPSFNILPAFLEKLCSFANADNGYFLHPIIKAIAIHFLLAYYHPFVDGNGRTARALFYWFMLKNGYWLTEYLSISLVINRSKSSYEKAYLQTELDGNDVGYFIEYNLKVLKNAFEDLKRYIETKIAQKQRAIDILSIGDINFRQASLLSMFRDNPKLALSINDVASKFGISKPTAMADITPLLDRGLLKKIPINHKQSNYIKGDWFDEKLGVISCTRRRTI